MGTLQTGEEAKKIGWGNMNSAIKNKSMMKEFKPTYQLL